MQCILQVPPIRDIVHGQQNLFLLFNGSQLILDRNMFFIGNKIIFFA